MTSADSKKLFRNHGRERVAAVAEAVRTEMESAYPLRVPLTVDAKVGANWRDMEAVK